MSFSIPAVSSIAQFSDYAVAGNDPGPAKQTLNQHMHQTVTAGHPVDEIAATLGLPESEVLSTLGLTALPAASSAISVQA